MAYSVKEVYCTLQGEGFHTGRVAVFVRFTGCNLWTGREEDRSKAVCTFCDTDFVGTDGPNGGKFKTAADLATHIRRVWDESTLVEGVLVEDAIAQKGPHSSAKPHRANPFIVCTGGEPLLQLDAALIDEMHRLDFEIAVETNGTVQAPEGIDWICVSPKSDAPMIQNFGDELKLVWYQEKAPPDRFSELKFKHFFLQPMDGPDQDRFTREAIMYCLHHPKWRLSLQTHKFLGIP